MHPGRHGSFSPALLSKRPNRTFRDMRGKGLWQVGSGSSAVAGDGELAIMISAGGSNATHADGHQGLQLAWEW